MDCACTEQPPAAAAVGDIALADLAPGTPARVVAVVAAGSATPPRLAQRLAELGFLPGESVRVVARGFLAREPVAVRVGTGTFALRRFEAACVRVCPEPLPAA
ncbi:MAG TPA: FeoA family protein [Steroidobacteraceae bacterium]|nr:FeoA family protein [Steroidobacteraceae bacterium]